MIEKMIINSARKAMLENITALDKKTLQRELESHLKLEFKYKDELDQSTNNWNELEEIILKEIEKCKEDEKIIRQNKIPKFYDIGVCAGIQGNCKFILDKMKEIKERKNER